MHDHDGLDLVSPTEAREAIAALEIGSGTERVPLREARGRVLAESVVAGIDVPGFDRASKDGYAVRAADTRDASQRSPVTLSVAGRVVAGEVPDVSVGAGEAVQIATGAVIPDGADAVVMVEDTAERGDEIDAQRALAPGENVMPAGTDIAAGDHGLSAGTALSPRTVGLLAALGRETVSVYRRPRVGIVPTGDELVAAGDSLRPEAGQVYDVNTPALSAAVASAGGEPSVRERVSDDREAMRSALESAAEEADLVLTSGATSAGATDVLVEIVEEIGEVQVHGVAIKPGKPTIVGRIDGTPYVGLPGYPVSALSVFRELVAPAIDAREDGWDRSVSARTARELRNDGGRHRLYAVGLVTDADGDRIAYPVDRGSGATTSLAYADGVVEIPAEQNYVAADDRVTVDLFDRESTPASVLCVGVRDPVVTAVVASVGRARALVRPGRTASRWLSDGIADAAVTTGDGPADGAERVAVFEREWGLVVDPALADSIGSLADLRGRRFVTLARETGLREAFDERVAAELDDDLSARVAGYAERAGFESARERVESGDADAALGLRPESGEPLAFVPLGTQRIAVDIAQQRREKPGVLALTDALSTAELPAGYERVR